MPIYMDYHPNVGDVTEDDIRAAHERALAVQSKYGVRFLTYWFNQPDRQSFCLVDSPDEESAIACHKEAHGLMPHKMLQVDKPTVGMFMGEWEANVPNEARLEGPGSEIDTGLRAIMFTDIVGSTDMSTREGDEAVVEMLSSHDRIVRAALQAQGGREVKHTGDGILASFTYVSRAVDCAIEIQRNLAGLDDQEIPTSIGISAGEPITQADDIFGAAVNLAARICAHASGGQILVSGTVRDLSIGKALEYTDRGAVALKGFDEPVRLFEVAYD